VGVSRSCARLVPHVPGAAVVVYTMLIAHIAPAPADDSIPSVTLGGGIQSSYFHCETACIYSPGSPSTPGGSVDGFAVETVRLYINGSITGQLKMTFDTEYTGTGSKPGDNKVAVMDAIARFEYSSTFNLWAGRFLPPSDRANFYGPYFANDWAPYADGVAGYYPDVFEGRDNGAAYWGDFGPLKVQAGAFVGESLNSAVSDKHKVLGAARVMWDLLDKESGYYLNGTYYGDKDVLALGLAAQNQNGHTGWNLDGLLDKRLGSAGVFTFETEYQHDDGLAGLASSHGWYALASYLFPRPLGWGSIQPLVKYSDKSYESGYAITPTSAISGGTVTPTYLQGYVLKTTEVDLNYIIKEFNARVGLYYLHQSSTSPLTFDGAAPNEFGLKIQLQM
jgi:hypothetical protein